MCGCKKNTQNLVQKSTAKVMGFSAQAAELSGTTIQFVGTGSNLVFWGSSTRTRYYFSTGDIATINEKDAESFLKLKHNGKNVFTKIEPEQLKSAIEAGDIMADLEVNTDLKTPNPADGETKEETVNIEAVVDQSGYTEDSYEDELPPFNEEELLPEEDEELPISVDEDGNEETTVKTKKSKKSKKKNNTEDE